jgi:hypothetical protein
METNHLATRSLWIKVVPKAHLAIRRKKGVEFSVPNHAVLRKFLKHVVQIALNRVAQKRQKLVDQIVPNRVVLGKMVSNFCEKPHFNF